MLVAATGVGAGDLLTASLAGATVGLGLLWAPIAGGVLKWTLNEGIARWQMATGTTLLEGWSSRLGGWARFPFIVYFLFWSLMVGGALVSACGVAGDGLLRLGDPKTSRIIWGVVHSLVGLALVRIGGFRLFEKVMSICIGMMFVTVILTAFLVGPDWGAVARGIFVPTLSRESLPWALGVLGGVGGTVTLLSYGYWIRESGREGSEGLRASRLDLAVAYAGTSLFGVAMILIGSRIQVSKSGGDVALQLADQLALALGPGARWFFLVGFWGAVFSSLLGVWQSAPYLFADFLATGKAEPPPEDLARTRSYQGFLVAIAVVPLVLLWLSVKQIQLAYAVMGAMFMPFLALTLLLMNNRTGWVGAPFQNRWWINVLLVVTLVFFAVTGILQLTGAIPKSGA
ncbi:divalent metal cation transporter [Candidatus Poribacteria bacterium]|nr:divalent metal cation transporter [Candidatus Poribacteria bacterium]